MRIVIADDHPLYRMGLRYALTAQGFDVVAEAGDGNEALNVILNHQPAAALLDVKMPSMSGIDVCERLRHYAPHVAVVLISTFAEPAILSAARNAGARGYLSKETGPQELAAALESIMRGAQRNWPPSVHVPPLTPREQDVLRLLTRGYSNKAMARELGLSPDTIKDHLSRLYVKFDADDRVGLLGRVRDLGLA